MHKCVSHLRWETGAKQVGQARGDNHVFLCAALPLRGADAETSGRPAPSVQPGMSAERPHVGWAVPAVDARGR